MAKKIIQGELSDRGASEDLPEWDFCRQNVTFAPFFKKGEKSRTFESFDLLPFEISMKIRFLLF